MTTTMNLSRTDLAVETAEALPTGRDMFAPGTGVTLALQPGLTQEDAAALLG